MFAGMHMQQCMGVKRVETLRALLNVLGEAVPPVPETLALALLLAKVYIK